MDAMNRSDRLASRTHLRLKLLLLFVVVAISLYVLIAGESGYLQINDQRVILESLQDDVVALQAQHDSLRNVLNLLEGNLEYLEKIAREEYGMKKPGERVYRIPESVAFSEKAK